MENIISIIIPVYNVERYLRQCLESVINQTYTNLEIILVNDGSSDQCAEICDIYASIDARIAVIHKTNGGLSDARNAGLKVATGDFISFVDSDDVVSVEFYEKLLKLALKFNADIVECNYLKFAQNEEINNAGKDSQSKIEIFNTQDAIKLLMDEKLKQVVWNKLYRIKLVKNIEFPIGKLNEDEFWTYKVFGNAKKILKLSDVLYYYRQQCDSIMGKAYNSKRLDGLEALKERIYYMEKHFPKLKTHASKVFCFASMWHYQKISLHPEIDEDVALRNRISKEVKEYNGFALIKKLSPNELVWFHFFLIFPHGYANIRNYFGIGI